MTHLLIIAFSFNQWWRGVTRELADYYNDMDTTHWGVIAALVVISGFVLLRTTSLSR